MLRFFFPQERKAYLLFSFFFLAKFTFPYAVPLFPGSHRVRITVLLWLTPHSTLGRRFLRAVFLPFFLQKKTFPPIGTFSRLVYIVIPCFPPPLHIFLLTETFS